MSQTSYSINQGVAVSGLIADSGPHDIRTFNNPVDVINYGRAVVKVSGDDNGCKLPAAGTDDVLGVAVSSLTNTTGDYQAEDAVSVLHRGRIYVEVEEAVTPDDDVFVRFANGAGGTSEGIFRTDADTATALQLTNARYLTSAGAGEFAIVDLNLV